MLRSGIIHADLSAHLARLRHTDRFCIADAGLPIPNRVPCVDLAVTYGYPRFIDVANIVMSTIVWQHTIVASELATANPAISRAVLEMISPAVPEPVDHEDFKVLLSGVSFVIRTGEATPYANIIVEAGVPF